MTTQESPYKQTLRHVYEHGVMRGDRTGKGRHGVFSPKDEVYDLSKGFPLTTLRHIDFSALIDELLWFVRGSVTLDNLEYKFFWKRWTTTEADAVRYGKDALGLVGDTDAEILGQLPPDMLARIGTIGHMYGNVWREAPAPRGLVMPFRSPSDIPRKIIEAIIPAALDGTDPCLTYEEAVEFLSQPTVPESLRNMQVSMMQAAHQLYWAKYDQINELVYKIKHMPNSSRLRVSAYFTDFMAFEEFSPQQNVMDGRAALTPCHTMFQCYVNPSDSGEDKDRTLDLKLTLTSSDVPVGRIYNIAQYAALTMMLAQVTDMRPGRLIVSSGDTHIYADQLDCVKELLDRQERAFPTLTINPDVKDIFDFKPQDFKLQGYEPHPAMKIPVAL